VSVTVNSFHTVEVSEDGRLATISNGMLVLFPGGLGLGPSLTMPLKDWDRLVAAVESARRVQATADYCACEGLGDDE
jgi:hypothetical protein